MRIKSNYFIIPLLVAAVAAFGSLFNIGGDTWTWYDALNQPTLTPPDWIFPIVWNTIFIMTAYSIIIVWNSKNKLRTRTISLFAVNGVLNSAWSMLFFGLQQINLAFIDILLIDITNLLLVFLTWKISKRASMLLWLYLGWVGFATFLNYQFMILNQ